VLKINVKNILFISIFYTFRKLIYYSLKHMFMKNRVFCLFAIILSSLLFAGCDWICNNPGDTETGSYMLTRKEIAIARLSDVNNGIKIFDMRPTDGSPLPSAFVVVPATPTGETIPGAAFKGARRCPPFCDVDERHILSNVLAPSTEPVLPDQVIADKGIYLSATVLNTILGDSCIKYITISSLPGGTTKVMGVNRSMDGTARGGTAF
jgi:hypothetical protein